MPSDGSPLLIDREFIAKQYLRGRGIEIGALHRPLRVAKTAAVKYVDKRTIEELRKQYPELSKHSLVMPDIICDGECLDGVKNGSQDFVIANHFLEHCQDPIKTILNILRALREGGVAYIAVPDRRHSFDRDRPPTDIEHILRDYREGPQVSRKQHFYEWVTLVNKREGDELIRRDVERLMASDYSIHYHAWAGDEFLELLEVSKREFSIPYKLQLFCRVGGEVVVILKKE